MERQHQDTTISEAAWAGPEDAVRGLYAAIEESARTLEVPCEPDKVLPLLNAYGDGLAEAVVAFRVATGERRAGDLDTRFTVPREVDPYQRAVEKGLLPRTGHPVGELLGDIRAHCPVDSYGIDFGIVGGLKKIWIVLPRTDLQSVAKLAGIPSMPRGLGASIDFFQRHGLGDTAGLLGIDYRNKTVNIYFGEQPAECFEPEAIRSMLAEAGQAAPTERMIALGRKAFGIYVTVSWDAPRLERICFAVATANPLELGVPIDPRIERFVEHVRASQTNRKFVYAVASQPDGEYYKLQSYYRWADEVMDIMQLSDAAIEDPV
ncbi:aromatic prenyltransferase [Streptomyces sp. NPDC005017]|uniref:aromatic prenyltransferase n=1 Tax=Streptomyces sp. NPDC005017 TaxID=3364706 RepID=UPI003685CCBC